MRIIYEAFDGTQFNDEFECKDYEWKKDHEKSLCNLIFYDKNGKILNNKLSEETYNKVMTINVLTTDAIKTLEDIGDYTGFCSYYDIDSIGEWNWNKKEEKFKKNEINFK